MDFIKKIIKHQESLSDKERMDISRKISESLHKKVNKGKKAKIWTCKAIKKGEIIIPGMKISKCSDCGCRVCYDPKAKRFMTFFSKKICMLCTVKNHKDEIDKDQLKFLKYILYE